MEIILYLSAAVAAIAFLILVIFLAKTLTSLQETLKSVSTTLTGLEGQLQGITKESTELLHKTNGLAEDIQKKSDDLNSVVFAIKDVGRSIQEFNSSIRKVSSTVSTGIDENKEKISQVVQWGNVLMELKDKWQLRKVKQESAAEEVYEERNEKVRKGRIHRSL
ncbi:general stress protein [Bacillus coahuilensis m2-6]|uniref:DUF948 domain-containing protein n=1 Tax=Bacillus coahuilensis TaxID=408580 RepID=UPI0007506C32|nr:DUF948 domain-containing protein [Bacillus coahuilensis]KUP06706.1 general stress protein [Bacillus coahuilensis m2-6]